MAEEISAPEIAAVPSDQPKDNSEEFRLFNFFRWTFALIGLCLIGATAFVLFWPQWRLPALHILWRSASSSVFGTSHNWAGYVISWIAIPGLVWLVFFILRFRQQVRSQPILAALGHSFRQSTKPADSIRGSIILGVWLTAFGIFVAKNIYDDHTGFATKVMSIQQQNKTEREGATGPLQTQVETLKTANKNMSDDLKDRQQYLHTEDPAWQHFNNAIQLMKGFRVDKEDLAEYSNCGVCELITSYPQGSSSAAFDVSNQIFRANGYVGMCTMYPLDYQRNLDEEDVPKMANDGIAPDEVVVHISAANKSKPWAKYMLNSLPFPIRSSEVMPKPINRFHTCQTLTPLIWLQFGKDVHWGQNERR